MERQVNKVDWFLKDLPKTNENSPTVFSCFHCCGGSTMGYKLAGFNVLGGVEIDPEMMSIYRENHKPKHSFLMGVSDFNKIENESIPKELFSLDVLDGSPPCSSFSTAGSREEKWGIKKKFREGQSEQILDDLFFDFIETAKKTQAEGCYFRKCFWLNKRESSWIC
jgi:DNA (cytosine-5)-methyltransferase 1